LRRVYTTSVGLLKIGQTDIIRRPRVTSATVWDANK
jgi:hypothetical protein